MQKNNDIQPLRPSAPAYDPRELQRQMTDGLPQWHHRVLERLLTLRLCAAVVALFAILVPLARHTVPYDPYRVADGMTYAQVVSLTDQLLHA